MIAKGLEIRLVTTQLYIMFFTIQICIAYALHLGLAVVPKSSKQQHLIDNFKAQEIQLDAEDLDQLKSLDRNMKLFDFGFIFLRPGQTLEGLWDVAEDEAFVLA